MKDNTFTYQDLITAIKKAPNYTLSPKCIKMTQIYYNTHIKEIFELSGQKWSSVLFGIPVVIDDTIKDFKLEY